MSLIEQILGRALAPEDLIIVIWPTVALLLVVCAYFASDPTEKRRKRRMDRVMGKKVAGGLGPQQAISVRKKTTHSDIAFFDALIRKALPRPELLKFRLAGAGLKISVGNYLMVCLALATVVTTATIFVDIIPAAAGVLIGLVVGAGFPHMIVGFLRSRRTTKFIANFPEAINLMVRGLKSGLPISESIKAASEEIADPVGSELKIIVDQIRVGNKLEDAMTETAARLGIQEFRFLTVALAIQSETGGNLAETLENLSDVLLKRRQLKLKIKALSSEAKASAYIIGSLPFVMTLIIHMTNDKYLVSLVTDIRGNIMVACGLLCFAVGAFVMYKMVKFEI